MNAGEQKVAYITSYRLIKSFESILLLLKTCFYIFKTIILLHHLILPFIPSKFQSIPPSFSISYPWPLYSNCGYRWFATYFSFLFQDNSDCEIYYYSPKSLVWKNKYSKCCGIMKFPFYLMMIKCIKVDNILMLYFLNWYTIFITEIGYSSENSRLKNEIHNFFN